MNTDGERNNGDDWEPSAALREQLLDVLEGRLSLEDPGVQAAMQGEPRFAAHLQAAVEVAGLLDDLHAAERRALTAPHDAMAAVAVAAARAQMGLPPKSAGLWRRPWLVLALAAGLTLAALLWRGFGPAPEPSQGPIHLGGTQPVQLLFEGDALRLAPAPEPGQYYRIDFRLGDKVLTPLILRRSDRLPASELRQHGDGAQVRATLLQGDEELACSEFVPLPPNSGR